MEDVDELIYTAVFSSNNNEKQQARLIIRKKAQQLGIFTASINNLYRAIGRGALRQNGTGFTVAAINIRTLTYDTARLIFRLMTEQAIGAVIFEIARSEIGYTDQSPDEYAVSILAAAVKENYQGPVFLQGDHFQVNEIEQTKNLIKQALNAGFYNIDIDASVLVNLSLPDLDAQQRQNYETTAELTQYVRQQQLQGVTVSIGGEIGHIGGKNSTVADFEAFMKGYTALVKDNGISKISVQTGTTHGGVPLPAGMLIPITPDFTILHDIGLVARKKYGLGGAVQHGASTLPIEHFPKFVEAQTLEIHLATGWQNIVFETMPQSLREEIYQWLFDNQKADWQEGWSKEQFIYKTRKKTLGPFKKKLWNLTDEEKRPMLQNLTQRFTDIFENLGLFNTKNTVAKYIHQ
ncbi:class II fructose-bisphosphate aldolase [Candidatus Microgenomates bacterium]|nr:class II fructose-bisphosphate aldolase [Candidatus Microgenomates bacterium]